MKIYKKCLKRKGEKIANKMVMLNAGVSDFCHIPMRDTLVPDAWSALMLNASANFIIFYFLYMTF